MLLASIAGASSLAGCMDAISDPTGGDGESTPRQAETETELVENGWMTGDVPLVRLATLPRGWVGQGPEEVTEQTNPTLRFEEGRTYEIIWENRDDARHQLVIADTDGQVVDSTEPAEGFGVVRSMHIAARDGLAAYYSKFHPESHRGEIQIV